MASGRRAKELRRNEDGAPRVQTSLSYVRAEGFNSPFPSANELRQIDDVVPNGAERVFALMEKQANHRMELEKKTIYGDATRANWGLITGFVIAGSFLISATYLILKGHEWAGGFIGTVDLVALVSVFVYGSSSRKQERESRDLKRVEAAERQSSRRKH